ncbi:MAG: hypothetical protein IJZ10_02415 [Thermoguttaceae bacterium]|nr:hypothetical protein [Thermoguttaceae bacterium]
MDAVDRFLNRLSTALIRCANAPELKLACETKSLFGDRREFFDEPFDAALPPNPDGSVGSVESVSVAALRESLDSPAYPDLLKPNVYTRVANRYNLARFSWRASAYWAFFLSAGAALAAGALSNEPAQRLLLLEKVFCGALVVSALVAFRAVAAKITPEPILKSDE